jgi:signal transduction histidine kinase
MAQRRIITTKSCVGKNSFIHYGSIKVTRLILYGSLGAALILTLLLALYDTYVADTLRARTVISLGIIIYLLITKLLLRSGRLRTVSWMLIVLYTAMAFLTLLCWGLNAAMGIFTTSFIIVISGILLGSRAIFPVTIGIVAMLVIVQTLHGLELVQPDLEAMSEQSTYLDVVSYGTILGIFSLITWISNSSIERALQRARDAEKSMRAQKDHLAIELEKESSQLREVKLNELRQLYRFATLGQSTAATLHELSNHLTVLHMDIVDLKQQNQTSKAIKNAEDSIHQINKMVRLSRRQLNSYDDPKAFNAIRAINRSMKDFEEKFNYRHVLLTKTHEGVHGSFMVKGSSMALIQIISILLNNALDACYDAPDPRVTISLTETNTELKISVHDNGVGIDPELQDTLFNPVASKKTNGLGVGLYIAHHLTKTQFNGSLQLGKTPPGALFVITLPRYFKK